MSVLQGNVMTRNTIVIAVSESSRPMVTWCAACSPKHRRVFALVMLHLTVAVGGATPLFWADEAGSHVTGIAPKRRFRAIVARLFSLFNRKQQRIKTGRPLGTTFVRLFACVGVAVGSQHLNAGKCSARGRFHDEAIAGVVALYRAAPSWQGLAV